MSWTKTSTRIGPVWRVEKIMSGKIDVKSRRIWPSKGLESCNRNNMSTAEVKMSWQPSFLSLLKRPVNCVRVLLPKVDAMACEYSCESCTEKAQCGWSKPDLTWTQELSLLKQARMCKIFNWLPMAYWKHHLWPDNAVVQKVVLYSLLQLLGLFQVNVEIHPVIQTCVFIKLFLWNNSLSKCCL